MTVVVMGWGTGPIAGAYAKKADSSVRTLRRELGLEGVRIERDRSADGGGRYGFRLFRDGKSCLVIVPGLFPDEIREIGWRLYVGGCSWIWDIAVKLVREELA